MSFVSSITGAFSGFSVSGAINNVGGFIGRGWTVVSSDAPSFVRSTPKTAALFAVANFAVVTAATKLATVVIAHIPANPITGHSYAQKFANVGFKAVELGVVYAANAGLASALQFAPTRLQLAVLSATTLAARSLYDYAQSAR